jgi:GxxExxY protein
MDATKTGKLLYAEESYKIRGACFQVYNTLGGGIKEKIIERALSAELKKQGMGVGHQVRISLSYLGEKIGTYIPDLVINDKIMIELKSKPFLTSEDEKQFWGYLKGSPYELGFLVAFTPRKLIIKRFIYTPKKSSV